MRPDKKKVRHHDSRKRAEAAKSKTQTKPDEGSSRPQLESNWQNYDPLEMPEDDSEEDNLTGLDYNSVIENAGGADSLLRMKSEKQWEETQSTFGTEFFALDLNNLEKAIKCIPIHDQLDISSDLNVSRVKFFLNDTNLSVFFSFKQNETIRVFEENASCARTSYNSTFCDANAVNNKILAALKIGPNEGTKPSKESAQVTKIASPKKPTDTGPSTHATKQTEPSNENESKNLEDWLDDFLAE